MYPETSRVSNGNEQGMSCTRLQIFRSFSINLLDLSLPHSISLLFLVACPLESLSFGAGFRLPSTFRICPCTRLEACIWLYLCSIANPSISSPVLRSLFIVAWSTDFETQRVLLVGSILHPLEIWRISGIEHSD